MWEDAVQMLAIFFMRADLAFYPILNSLDTEASLTWWCSIVQGRLCAAGVRCSREKSSSPGWGIKYCKRVARWVMVSVPWEFNRWVLLRVLWTFSTPYQTSMTWWRACWTARWKGKFVQPLPKESGRGGGRTHNQKKQLKPKPKASHFRGQQHFQGDHSLVLWKREASSFQ